MAEQTVRVENLPNGSKEDVAFRLWKELRFTHKIPEDMAGDLKLFSECRKAVYAQVYDISQLT